MVRKRSLSVILPALLSSTALGQFVYEPFDYPAGATLNGQASPTNGRSWCGMGTSTDKVGIDSNQVAIPGMPDPIGNCALYGGIGNSERLQLTPFLWQNSTLYYSLA